jgi:NCS1 family nucleobase:cation symporter-1
MPLFAFIGIAVTSATVLLYGEAIWNPVDLVSRLAAESNSPLLGIVAMLAILVATLTTNVAANVVAPANSFANLSPQRVSFRTGGLLAGLLGIAILPWKLLDMYQGWLISYSGLLGAVGGVIVCDYLVLRRGKLVLADLYRRDGVYGYTDGVNWSAIAATIAGILVALIGLVVPGLRFLFSGAWFSAAIISFVTYYLLMRPKTP